MPNQGARDPLLQRPGCALSLHDTPARTLWQSVESRPVPNRRPAHLYRSMCVLQRTQSQRIHQRLCMRSRPRPPKPSQAFGDVLATVSRRGSHQLQCHPMEWLDASCGGRETKQVGTSSSAPPLMSTPIRSTLRARRSAPSACADPAQQSLHCETPDSNSCSSQRTPQPSNTRTTPSWTSRPWLADTADTRTAEYTRQRVDRSTPQVVFAGAISSAQRLSTSLLCRLYPVD